MHMARKTRVQTVQFPKEPWQRHNTQGFPGFGNKPPAALAHELNANNPRTPLPGGMGPVEEEESLTCVFYPRPVTLAKDDSGEHVIPPIARRLL